MGSVFLVYISYFFISYLFYWITYSSSKFVAQFVNIMCSKSTASKCEGSATLDVSDMNVSGYLA